MNHPHQGDRAQRALVLGATGQIGRFLLPELLAQGVEVEALSRQAQPPQAHILWSRFDLYHNGDAARRPDVVFSAGPIDGLMAWLARTRHRPTRIVAFSSTSAQIKQNSPDPTERELAARLLQAEQALALHCDARDIGWTILRPTLVYGCGLDANLSRIVALARRWRFVPVPRGAHGLRQPVHAQDLAIGAWQAANTPASLGKRYDLCGADTIEYTEMVRRTVAFLTPRAYLLQVPSGVIRGLARLLRRYDLIPGFGPAMLDRMRQDLVFSTADASRDLGWSPRGFRPGLDDFPEAPALMN